VARGPARRAAPRSSRGGQPCYSALAITTALALRQTAGLIGSILQQLGLDLAVPDHSTLSRRAETLPVLRPKAGTSACTC
jgi:Transposase DDE domain